MFRKIAPEAPGPHTADRLAAELIRVLPPAGTHFTLEQREAWLTGAAALLDQLYGQTLPPVRVVCDPMVLQ